MSKKELTEKQQIFVDVFYDAAAEGLSVKEAGKIAKEAAGYSDNTSLQEIYTSLGDAFLSRANLELSVHIPRTVAKAIDVMDNPNKPGAKNVLSAAFGLMDRQGLVKKEQINVTVNTNDGVVLLPPKKPVTDDNSI